MWVTFLCVFYSFADSTLLWPPFFSGVRYVVGYDLLGSLLFISSTFSWIPFFWGIFALLRVQMFCEFRSFTAFAIWGFHLVSFLAGFALLRDPLCCEFFSFTSFWLPLFCWFHYFGGFAFLGVSLTCGFRTNNCIRAKIRIFILYPYMYI